MYYNDSEQQVTVCDISTLSCSTTIGGLEPYTVYSIEVSSSTAAGEGPRTNPSIICTSIAGEFIKLFTAFTMILYCMCMQHLYHNPVSVIQLLSAHLLSICSSDVNTYVLCGDE